MKKKAILRSVLLVAVACVGVCRLQANSLLLGDPANTGVTSDLGDPGVGDCAPFGCPDDSTYQQLYLSSLFAGPITISGLTFFDENFDHSSVGITPMIYQANYTITFSVISSNVLDPTVANNLNSASEQVFFAGALGDGLTEIVNSFTISQNQGNFFYDPSQGNLVMQVTNDGSSGPTFNMFMDVDQNYSGFAVAFDSNPEPSADQCNLGAATGNFSGGDTTGCMQSGYGLVTQFETVATSSTVPEPGGAETFCALLSSCLYWIRRKSRIR